MDESYTQSQLAIFARRAGLLTAGAKTASAAEGEHAGIDT